MLSSSTPKNKPILDSAGAIATGDLTAVQSLITSDDINSIIHTHVTPLFQSIKFNQLLIFYFLLNHRGLDLAAKRQGSLCVNMALSLYRTGVNKNDQEYVANATKMVLGLFKKNNYDPDVSNNNNFIFEPMQMDREIEGKEYPLVDLVDAITEYQKLTESNYIVKLRIQIRLRNKIAKILLGMDEHQYSDDWNYLSAKSALKSILRSRSIPTLAFSGYDADFVHALELAVSFYYRKSKQYVITPAQAFSASLIIARMNLLAGADQDIVSRWLHRAHKIASNAAIQNQNATFVATYVKFISDNVSEKAVSKSNGLANKAEYFLALNQDAVDARSVLEGASESKDDLVPLRLIADHIITEKHVYKDKKMQKTLKGLTAMFGFKQAINYKEASDIFAENALEQDNTDQLYTFYSYLLSAVSQNKLLSITQDYSEKSKIIQTAMKTFTSMLPFYSNAYSLPYHIEIYELLTQFSLSCAMPADKFSVFTMLLEYYTAIANFQVDSPISKLDAIQRKQLLDNLFTSICDICSRMRTSNWELAIKMLQKCINANDSNEILKILFLHFDQLAEKAKTRDEVDYLYTQIKNAKASAYLNKVAVLDLDGLKDAIQNFKQLKEKYASVATSFIELELKCKKTELICHGSNHSIIYRTLGEKLTDSDEKLAAFQTAIDLGDYSLVGLSYITQLIKLTFCHIEKNRIRRGLYLSTRLISEFTLNKADIIRNYQFTEEMIHLISSKAWQFIGNTANARTILPGIYQELAQWYINLLPVVVKLSNAKNEWAANNPQIELPEIDIDSLLLINAEECSTSICNNVRIGMTQSMEREANFLDQKRNAFEQLTKQWGEIVRLVPLSLSDSIVEEVEVIISPVSNGIVSPASNSSQVNTVFSFYKEKSESKQDPLISNNVSGNQNAYEYKL